MLIEEQFRALVLVVPAVTALIGERLSPVFLRPGETLPAATYRRSSTSFLDETLEDENFERPHMEIILWGMDYVALKTAMAALKQALRTGTFADPIAAISLLDEEDTFDDRYQHADGVGLPGIRLACELILTT